MTRALAESYGRVAADLEMQAEALVRTARFLRQLVARTAETPVPAPVPAPAPITAQPEPVDQRAYYVTADGANVTHTQRVFTAMAKEPGRVWNAFTLFEVVDGSELEQIRMALVQLCQRGEIVRLEPGRYRLPTAA